MWQNHLRMTAAKQKAHENEVYAFLVIVQYIKSKMEIVEIPWELKALDNLSNAMIAKLN